MRRIQCALLSTAAVIGFASVASAADMPVKAPEAATFEQRWYVESRLAVGIIPRYSVSTTGLGDGTYAPQHAFNLAFDVGIYLTRNWRAEVEVALGRISQGTAYGLPHSGSARMLTLLGNALYSFDAPWPWMRPYVGGGVGLVNTQVSRIGAIGGAFVIDGSATAFAAALHAGLDFPVWQRLTITSRYTALWTGSESFGSIPAGVTLTKKPSLDNIFTVGLRYNI
jgi:opacity protein-like surface antigen